MNRIAIASVNGGSRHSAGLFRNGTFTCQSGRAPSHQAATEHEVATVGGLGLTGHLGHQGEGVVRLQDSGPAARRTILYDWISASTRIWGRHKIELFGVILKPRIHSDMEFVNDDDDDDDDAIYDGEHRFKWSGLKYILI